VRLVLERYRPFTAGARWVDELLAADPGDAGCDVTFQVLDRYIETQLHGQDPGRRFPAVAAHLPLQVIAKISNYLHAGNGTRAAVRAENLVRVMRPDGIR
jgi:hypothetical protein